MDHTKDLAFTSQLFKGIWENSPDNFFVLEVADNDFKFVGINPAQERVLGVKSSEVEGKGLREIISAEFYDFVTKNYWRCLREKRSIKYEEEEKYTSGTTKWWSTMLCPILGEDEEIQYIFGISRSITELKHSEKRYQQAAAEAEEANLVKTKFLANMSHDMRTPLNGISGAASLICDMRTDEERGELATIIKTSVDMLTHLTGDILEYAKLGAGKLKLDKSDFDLVKLLSSVKNLLDGEAEKKGCRLILDVDDNLPSFIHGDAQRLKQVLVNLANNAVKFTDNGDIHIVVDCHTKTEKATYIDFSVVDEGIGISEENIPKLFKPFSQVDDSYTKNYEGTGLGLAICKNLVELMGGVINVSSRVGSGSKFSFRLSFPISNDIIESDPETIQLSGHFLLVEDNSVNQVIVERLLKKHGAEVTIAENGNVAIQLCERNTYDIILMDWHMPVMDGVTATLYLRNRLPNYKKTPIIGLTANVLASDQEKCYEAGMNDILSKPINAEEFLIKLEYWLR